jgi:hypothetical protein
MIKLKDLIPNNLETEKEKFFTNNFSYNPQFEYNKRIPLKDLEKYGKTKLKYIFLAKRIVRKYQKTNPNIKNQEIKTPLSEDFLKEKIKKYLSNYHLEKKYKINFSEKYISRIAVNFKSKEIKVRKPILIGKGEINAVLNHEIGTHVLRQENYEQQSWYKKKKKYNFKDHIKTEEGLAIINEMIESKNKIAYKSAVNYIGVNLARKKSFTKLFKFFNQHWQDPERAWTWTLKKKRGVRNTAKKIAFSKDLVYFEGFVQVIKYLQKNNYDPSLLYYGKLDLSDIEKAKKMNPEYNPILPKFYSDDPQNYKKKIKQIAKENLL